MTLWINYGNIWLLESEVYSTLKKFFFTAHQYVSSVLFTGEAIVGHQNFQWLLNLYLETHTFLFALHAQTLHECIRANLGSLD